MNVEHLKSVEPEAPGQPSAVPAALISKASGRHDGLREVRLDFGRAGNGDLWRGGGWGKQEEHFVRTAARQCDLTVPNFFESTPLLFEVDVEPWLHPPMVSMQIMRVVVNGHQIGAFKLTSRSTLKCCIAPELLADEDNILIEFHVPSFVNPRFIVRSGEVGCQGLSIYSALIRKWDDEIDEASPPARQDAPLEVQDEAYAIIHSSEKQPSCLDFRNGGYSRSNLGEGWSIGIDGAVWANGPSSNVVITIPEGAEQCYIKLALVPLRVDRLINAQRLTVIASGAVVGQYHLLSETCLLIPLPVELTEGKDFLNITLVTPNALPMKDFADPNDKTMLGLVVDKISIERGRLPNNLINFIRDDESNALRPIAVSNVSPEIGAKTFVEDVQSTIDMRDVLKSFESLGDRCFFGVAQRKAGVETLALLRFGSTPYPSLMSGLEEEFSTLADPAGVSVTFGEGVPREFLVESERYGIVWHTFKYEDQANEAEILAENITKLGYLRRRFFEGLRGGRRIYVICRTGTGRRRMVVPMPGHQEISIARDEPLSLAEALIVWQFLQRFSNNTLLYIVPSRPTKPPGLVELLAPGILRGYVSTIMVSEDLSIADHYEWLRVVANAWKIDRTIRTWRI